MKYLRGLYILLVYVLSLPLVILFALGISIWVTILCIMDRDIEYWSYAFKGFTEGAMIGHHKNMLWVKHGNKFYTVPEEEV